MSVPTEFDWALIKMGDGGIGENPETFTLICGIVDVSVNQSVNTTDRARRDCAKPGETPFRYTRSNSKQLDISGSGLSNAEEETRLNSALGKVVNYKIEGYQDDGSDAGTLLGTYSGAFRMTAKNLSMASEGDSSAEITLASHGPWTYAEAA